MIREAIAGCGIIERSDSDIMIRDAIAGCGMIERR
jgi:hypothetical protein